MSLKFDGIADILASDDCNSTLLVEGEAIIAHVHSPDHVQLFAHAEEMRQLLIEFAKRPCDKAGRRHLPQCRTCAATALLQGIDEAKTRSSLH
jgi:hypothetical protein